MKAQSLKNAILQLAVQGKLVAQNPQDEPASELLKRIKAEKATLIKEKKIKTEPPLAEITDEEKPFDIPESWEWVRLGILCKYGKNESIDANNIDENSWVLDLEDIEKDTGNLLKRKLRKDMVVTSTKHKFTKGNILYSKLRPYLNKVIVADNDGFCTSEILVLDFGANINARYAQKMLMSPLFVSYATACSYGVKMPRLGTEDGRKAIIPLPPLAEQQRIVKKIEQLMPLVEKYDSYEKELSALEAKFPSNLKKSVLQFAVQGKLVPQNNADEPASELLEKIKAEKAKLIKEKKIKAEKPLAPITDEEKLFEIPDSWEWVRLDELCSYIQRGKSPKYSDVRKIPVIAQKCNQWEGFSIDKAKFIAPDSIKGYAEERLLQDFDLMWNSTGIGTLGRIAMYETRLNLYSVAVADSHVTVIRAFRDFVLSAYLLKYFSSPFVQNVIEDKSDGSTKQKELSTSTIKNYIVPLPPLAEQQRIIKKVEQMLALCDVLADESKLKKHQPPKRLAKIIEFTSVGTEEEHEHLIAARADEINPETRAKELEHIAELRRKR